MSDEMWHFYFFLNYKKCIPLLSQYEAVAETNASLKIYTVLDNKTYNKLVFQKEKKNIFERISFVKESQIFELGFYGCFACNILTKFAVINQIQEFSLIDSTFLEAKKFEQRACKTYLFNPAELP